MNFNNSIYINRTQHKLPLLAAHRGVCGANVPCNTLLAFEIAVRQDADIIELDVAKSKDGELFVFHPGMESVYLKSGRSISEMTAKEVLSTPILNCDEAKTHYRIPTLAEAFAILKDKVYINVDKFWTDIKGISAVIRKAGVEKQVIVKTPTDENYISEVEKYAYDFMFMPVMRHKDDITDKLKLRNINYIGAEVLFDSLNDEVASKNYINYMHEQGLLVWVNSIVYDENDVISAGLTDDVSLEKGASFGWGKLYDLGYDIIQTDWLLQVKQYFSTK